MKDTAGRTRPALLRLAPVVVAGMVGLGSPAPALAQAESPCGGFHQVREGDTLGEIAQRCGVTVPALLAANPELRGITALLAGGTLTIPAPNAPPPTPQEACGAFYTVRAGDTVQEVAAMCGLTVAALSAANGALPTPLGLAAGARMRIPPLPRRVATDTTGVVWTAAARDTALTAAGAPAIADTARDTAADAAAGSDLVRRVGVLRQGARCLLLELDDGERVGLTGSVSVFDPGDRVAVVGVERQDTPCETDLTLEPRIIWRDDS